MDVDELRAMAMENARRQRENGELIPSAIMVAGAGHLDMIAMPDSGDEDMRFRLRELAARCGATAVACYFETWYVAIPKDAPREVRERLELAHLTQTLDQQPERREKAILYAEGADVPIRRWEAEIVNGVLGEWEEASLQLPRPTFKRYLVERQTVAA